MFLANFFEKQEKEITLSFLASISTEQYAIVINKYSSDFAEVVSKVAELNFRNALLIKKIFARNKELTERIKQAVSPVKGLYGLKGTQIKNAVSLCEGVA